MVTPGLNFHEYAYAMAKNEMKWIHSCNLTDELLSVDEGA